MKSFHLFSVIAAGVDSGVLNLNIFCDITNSGEKYLKIVDINNNNNFLAERGELFIDSIIAKNNKLIAYSDYNKFLAEILANKFLDNLSDYSCYNSYLIYDINIHSMLEVAKI